MSHTRSLTALTLLTAAWCAASCSPSNAAAPQEPGAEAALPEAPKSEASASSAGGDKSAETAALGAAPTSPIVLGYFTNWAHTRPKPCTFKTSDVDVGLFTHINYAFALVGVKNGDKNVTQKEELTDASTFEVIPSSPEDEARLFQEVNDLKKKKPTLKTFLSIGGWGFNDAPTEWIFSSMAETKQRRTHFISQTIAYARKHGFDGIDIDWEFPGATDRGGRPEDTQNFTSLLVEFRGAMKREAQVAAKPELLLTIATPAGPHFLQHQELSKVHKPLNWINVMTYDYHGEWEMKTGANAPVSGDELNLTTSIAAYKAAGVPKEKMVLGFATYARGWSGVDSPALGVPATGKGPDGPCGVGSLTAAQAQAWTKGGGYTEFWSEETKTPFAYSKAKKTLVSYDNARAYDAKLTLLKAEGLAGAMFWAIDLDDFQAGYPLIGQVSRSLGVAPAEPEQASPSPISPQKKP